MKKLKDIFSALYKKYLKLIFKDRVLIRQYKNHALLLRPTNHIDSKILRGVPYEEEQINFVKSTIAKEKLDTFIDVGANIGIYSISLCSEFEELTSIVAIEAQIENYNQLCGNIHINKMDRRIKAYNIGASDSSGTVRFMRNTGRSTGTSRMKDTAPQTTKWKNFEEETINVDSLDNIIGHLINRNIFFKIDVEGHEIPVLYGMQGLLVKNKCYLQIEILAHQSSLIEDICSKFNLIKTHQIENDVYFHN